MKDKKGFTLVELLAVIAILAILMVLITPNILRMFENGKKEAFEVQVRKLISNSETKYQSDTLEGQKVISYCDFDGLCPASLKLSDISTDLRYTIMLDGGKVAYIAVENKDYCYVKSGNVSEIDKNDFVKNGKVEMVGITNDSISLSCGENIISAYMRSNYSYWDSHIAGGGVHYNSSTIPPVTVPWNIMLSLNLPAIYNRTRINDSNEPIEQQICVIKSDKDLCIETWLIKEDVTRMKTWLENKNYFDSCTNSEDSVTCILEGAMCTFTKNNKAYCTDTNGNKCSLASNGEAWCD